MFNLKSLCKQALFALMLALAAGSAAAGPTYHVAIDTTTLAVNGTGHMDFLLAGNVPGAETIVTLSNFSGAFGGETERFGGVAGALPGLLTLVNTDTLNYLTQAVAFGGLFGFDVSLSGAFETTGGADGAVFGVSLFNQDMDAYLAADIVSFSLIPAAGGTAALVTASAIDGMAAATQVPEPSELLLMLTGLGLMGWIVRRRAAR